jgi:hypothetical protein
VASHSTTCASESIDPISHPPIPTFGFIAARIQENYSG